MTMHLTARKVLVTTYLLALVGLIIWAWAIDRRSLVADLADLRDRITAQSAVVVARFQREIVGKEAMSHGLAGSLAANPNLTSDQFQEIARHIMTGDEEVRTVVAAPDLEITYVYPRTAADTLIGLRYDRSRNLYPDVRRTIESGDVTMSGPIHLVEGGEGLIIRMPVFVAAPDGQDLNDLWGLTAIVVDVHELFHSTGIFDLAESFDVSLRRFTADGEHGAMVLGNPASFDADPVLHRIDLRSGDWQLGVLPRGGWPVAPQNRAAIWTMFLLTWITAIAICEALFRLWRGREEMRRMLVDGIEAIDDGFVIFDAQDRFVMCNARYRKIYIEMNGLLKPGAAYEDLVREAVRRGQYPDAGDNPKRFISDKLVAHRTGETKVQNVTGGHCIQISENRTATGHTVGLHVDVTKLTEARAAAEGANRAKTDFLNTVSHELRTPLTVILGYLSLLKNLEMLPQYRKLTASLEAGAPVADLRDRVDAFAGEVANYAGRIDTSGHHLKDLINSVLDWAKIESGELSIDVETVEADAILREIGDQVTAIAGQKGLAVETWAEPAVVRADPIRLRQILLNLAGNAVKFTREGTIEIACKRDGHGAVIFTVTDTGCGIAPENQRLVFDRFKQVDGSDTRSHGGTGLGLAITRELVLMQDGEIALESKLGQGSRFIVRLPEAQDAQEPSTASEEHGTLTAA